MLLTTEICQKVNTPEITLPGSTPRHATRAESEYGAVAVHRSRWFNQPPSPGPPPLPDVPRSADPVPVALRWDRRWSPSGAATRRWFPPPGASRVSRYGA
ncbi:hypothetical protein NL676_004465 [Syzygium grande]|nr:hypothetical protein NL676_004465 [Syzygium grande]